MSLHLDNNIGSNIPDTSFLPNSHLVGFNSTLLLDLDFLISSITLFIHTRWSLIYTFNKLSESFITLSSSLTQFLSSIIRLFKYP